MTTWDLAKSLGLSIVMSAATTSLTWAQAAEPTPPAAPVAPPPPADGAAPAAPSAPVSATSTTLEGQGCTASSALERSGKVYAACGERSVWILSKNAAGELEVLEKRRIDGSVRGLFVQGDDVWVASQRETAQPLRDTALEALVPVSLPSTGTAVAGVAPARPSSPEGQVISAKDQEVVISLGTQDGVRLGDRIEVYTLRAATSDQDMFANEKPEETVLVGVVTAVSASHARLSVGFGERAAPGMKAHLTSLPRSTIRVAPPRLGKQLILEGSIRPFLPVDKLAFAAQGDASATYLPEFDAYAKVELRPLGLLVGKDFSPSYAGAYASGGYDQTYFGLGLGVGVLYGQHSTNPSSYYNGEYHEKPIVTENRTRFSALQHVRLGARDGLRVALSTAVSLAHDRWQFAWIEGDIQAPIGSRSWFTVRGSGSADGGYFFGEVGFRRMVRGNGGPGSLFLRPSAGIAGIGKRGTGDSSLSVGPLVGLHVETRLAR